jgi:hypothetical protein
MSATAKLQITGRSSLDQNAAKRANWLKKQARVSLEGYLAEMLACLASEIPASGNH